MTLTEVLIALLVLLLVMAGSYQVLSATARLRRRTHDHYTAAVIANNRIERAKTLPFDLLPMLEEQRTRVSATGAPDPGGPFLRTTTVETSYAGHPRLTRVTVRVELASGPGMPAESVSTLLTEYLEPEEPME